MTRQRLQLGASARVRASKGRTQAGPAGPAGPAGAAGPAVRLQSLQSLQRLQHPQRQQRQRGAEELEERRLNLKEAVKRGEISQAEYVEQTRRWGGDFEHAGLVSGLDWVLLEKVRRGESGLGEGLGQGLGEVDLEAVYGEVKQQQQQSQPPPQRPVQPPLPSKFRRIGEAKEEKKEVKKSVKESEKREEKEPEEEGIFGDVGEYTLLDALEKSSAEQVSKTNQKKEGYFGASVKDEDLGLVDAGSLTREAILRDNTQLASVLKKAAALDSLSSERKAPVHPMKKPVDMGFGLWLGEAYDDLDMHDEPLDEDDEDQPAKPKKRVKSKAAV